MLLEIVEDDGQVVPIPSTSLDFRPIQPPDSTTVGPTNLWPREINRTPTINMVPDIGQINVGARPQVLTRPKELLNMKWKKSTFQKSETIKLLNNISSMTADPLEFFCFFFLRKFI